MPWIALVPDISGVCSIVGTFEITSKPTNTASTKIVISLIRLMRLDRSARSLLDALVHDLAVVGDGSAGDDLVLEVEVEVALRRQVLEQVHDVVRVQQAGVERHLAREVQRAVDRHAVAITWPGAVSSQLPPVSAARSTITDPGRIRAHHLGADELRRRAARALPPS